MLYCALRLHSAGFERTQYGLFTYDTVNKVIYYTAHKVMLLLAAQCCSAGHCFGQRRTEGAVSYQTKWLVFEREILWLHVFLSAQPCLPAGSAISRYRTKNIQD